MPGQAEDAILERLVYASERDPSLPSFPVTRTHPFLLPGFSDVWLKDESTNPTGTHKDRMAWEIVMAYKDMLQRRRERGASCPLPAFSILSAGSAALAVQHQLARYSLPSLRVLVDVHTSPSIVAYLESIGARTYSVDLSAKLLSSDDILELTDNRAGFDITSNKGFDPSARFYDWLAYEILNLNPRYVLVPVGTGQLLENILNAAKDVAIGRPLAVYSGDPSAVRDMHFIGATSSDPRTKAVKLYAPFRPFSPLTPEWIALYAKRGWCGEQSTVRDIGEESLQAAYELLRAQGVPAEHSAAAGLAALLETRGSVEPDSRIVIVSTGRAKFPRE